VNEELISLEIDKLKIIKTLTFTQGTLINLLRNILQAVMLWMIFTGMISIGEFFTLLFYSFFLFSPLYSLPDVAKNIQSARASSETLEDIFSLEKEIHTIAGKEIDTVESIKFKDVSFSYDDSPALENIDRSLKLGETVAFV
jgi:ATP-binding cassette subfamily B protein